MNAPVQIRTADAAPPPPPTLDGLTEIERQVYATLVRAEGAFVACTDLTTEIYGAVDAPRMRGVMRYVGNVRIALRTRTGCSIVSNGANADLRYALIATAQPAAETVRSQRTVLCTIAPDGDQTVKGRITQALIAAGGRFLSVADLCRVLGVEVDARSIATMRSRVNEIRSVLRMKGIAASVLSQGVGEALSYAWSETIEAAAGQGPAALAEADPDAPRPTMRITLPPVGGRSCIYDGDSLVIDGVKQPRVERRA
ncbi:hypothetical protein MKK70_04955 [Methylobacterium sp. E-041]|uniref:hypothetical protein n=1 Tax=Methylobacterium sp. E-041 TaxID=2836573 RepID=UPI001FB97A9E|nr:hypothetical protein [Methylobacterium sp. E-041]MCJ2104736.1 hypothetical protein [Methylobacterium sp. E-041]